MGRNLSPVLRRELENLDKDSASRKSAMKALKSYLKDLDSKSIPIFLAQVSETKETGSTSGEYTISLYEVLARFHGTEIVPQIDNIMLTIIKTLTSSAGSFPLHQACSKVVPAIARYGIDPMTPDVKKREIIHSLCKPLSDSILSSHENLSSGAALCLRALVDSDNWRFASGQMVNEVCQRVAAALENSTQTNAHMGLVMSLAKHNALVVEDYARLLIRSGVGILKMGVDESNSQKRFLAIQMVNYLIRNLDYKCIVSELTFVIEEFEKCQNDQMAYVKVAAFEAIQMAKKILSVERGSRTRDQSTPVNGSPRSETMSYSPFTISFASRNDVNCDRRSMNRKLWSDVDVSLKDGLFSGEMSTPRSVIESFENQEDYEDEFSGFVQRSPNNGYSGSRSRSYVNVNNTNLFTTPRKLVKSLQVPNDDFSDNQSRRFRSPSSSKFNWSPNASDDQNGVHNDLNESFANAEQLDGTSESVSSTADIIPLNANQNGLKLPPSQQLVVKASLKSKIPIAVTITSGLFVLIAVVCFLWVRELDEGCYNLVPT
ncbi:protein SINE1-like [Rutidosis leptorrhynchoides]|uniref:protein SINE1-like n=1 Tax=Rutidosis leptorrhynchoides TaxID=125765 RepID=UPI003A992689